MESQIVRHSSTRTVSTPNAVMTTLASPTLNHASELSLWRVTMTKGQQGPPHHFDVEQVWTVLDGAPAVELDEQVTTLGPGDTITVPAYAVRRFSAEAGDVEFLVCGRSIGRATPLTTDGPGDAVLPPWIA